MKYLYNGIKLPKLPNYDTTAYPNAYIVRLGETESYMLMLLPAGWSYSYDSGIVASGVVGAYYGEYDNLAEWQYENTVENPVIQSDSVTPVWANFDILAEDGSVYLAASEPVASWDARSFWMGVAMGLAGKGLIPGKPPTAHLYNGVKLPALPEWDRETYPYANIYYENSTKVYQVTFTSAPCTYYGTAGKYIKCPCPLLFAKLTDGAWSELTAAESGVNGNPYKDLSIKNFAGATYGTAVWSNHDIMSEIDSTVYLAASEPAPVYE